MENTNIKETVIISKSPMDSASFYGKARSFTKANGEEASYTAGESWFCCHFRKSKPNP